MSSKVVDIGSRLGSVLLVGSLFSNAKEYIGIEIDPFFSKLSQSTIEQFKLENVKVKMMLLFKWFLFDFFYKCK